MTENTRTIELTQGQVAIVDAGDYDWLSQWKWGASRDHSGNFRAVRCGPRVNGKQPTIYMHRLIMGEPDDMFVDHINRNPLDNRRVNLRVCTQADNGKNRTSRKGSSSQYIGVSWKARNRKWQAALRTDSKTIYIGIYASEIEAARAYDVAARRIHGEFANPNFPIA